MTRLTHRLNVISSVFRRSLPIHYRLGSFFDEEADALVRERYLIQSIGRHDLRTGPLTNQTDGGEGTSNPSEESRQRRRDSLWGDGAADPERQIANSYFRKLASVQSVTLKPTLTWGSATTLAASAIQNRVMLEPGALIPRRLQVGEVEFIIEKGVGSDMLSSDMAIVADATPAHETLCLTADGFRFLVRELDRGMPIGAGVLSPEYE